MEIITFEDLKNEIKISKKRLDEIAQDLELRISNLSQQEFKQKVKKALDAMKEAIAAGLKTKSETNGKMGGFDCYRLQEFYKSKKSLFNPLFEKTLCYALATSEENARMGRIVACPTAGACGIVPGVLVAFFEEYNIPEEDQIKTLMVAGLIGKLISNKVKPAGAIAGCQAECGTASAMAAGAIMYLLDGSIDQVLNAIALCLKNILGLTCDPVRGYVEVPCIKRNPFLALHAFVAVELARASISSVIPVDEVIDAMKQTGALMNENLKENSKAGLAKTKTAVVMEKSCFTKKYYSELND